MRVPVMLKLRWEPMSEKWTEIWAYEAVQMFFHKICIQRI